MTVNRGLTCLLFCFLIVVSFSFGSTVVTGNSGSSTTTFDFSVGPIHFALGAGGTIGSTLVGAGEEKAGNTFSLAIYSPAAAQFIPIGVSTVTLNNQKDQSNPLTGKKIKFLSTHYDRMNALLYFTVIDKENISVPAAQQERFYSFPAVELSNVNIPTDTKVTLVQSDVPKDAGSVNAGYINNVVSLRLPDASSKNLVLGAVNENGKAFGVDNSGIAAAQLIKNKDGYALSMYNLSMGILGNQSIAFNNSLLALKIGSNVTINTDVDPAIDMHWNSRLERLYIAVSVTSAVGVNNGARAIVVGRFEDGKLIFEKFVPDAAVTGSSNDIIIGANNGRSSSIYKVRTMLTSTGVHYLIVNGGNNAVAESGIRKVANQVYAIPLVDLRLPTDVSWKTSALQGTASKVTVAPVADYNEKTRRLRLRSFRTAASTSDDLFKTSDQAAQVGAGNVPFILPDAPTTARTVKDMFVKGDAVYVSVAADYGSSGGQPQQPGLFHSRAIFDENGAVAAWTPWELVAGTDERNYGASIDTSVGNFWFLTGSGDSNVNTVKRTLWGIGAKDGLLGGTTSDASVGLVSLMNQQLPEVTGGVQAMSIFDANNNVVGIPNSGLTGTTVLLASGYKKFLFIKTGDNSKGAGTIQPYTGDFATGLASNNNGTFPVGSDRVFAVSMGALDNIGSIVTNTIFSNSARYWIAVGGVGGLAILSDSSGQGSLPGSMPTGFTFKKVGNYRFVKKVVSDGYYLYVLTNRSLDRIVINPSSFVSGSLQRTTLATSVGLGLGNYGSFSDLLVGDKMALLATSKGLFRIANGSSVKVGTPLWLHVPTAESTGPMFTLSFASSSTDLNTGLANRGQVFGLSSYQGYDQSRIYRFYLNEGSTISDSSFQNINDLFVENKPTYLASFGQMRGHYTDDGSMRLVTRPGTCTRAMEFLALSSLTHVGYPASVAGANKAIDVSIGSKGSIGRTMRSNASGAWLLDGSFGLRVNE